MIEDNSYEQNADDFNRMFNEYSYNHYKWDEYTIIDVIVEKIEAEYAMNCMLNDLNVIHINRFRDVLKWADIQKFLKGP